MLVVELGDVDAVVDDAVHGDGDVPVEGGGAHAVGVAAGELPAEGLEAHHGDEHHADDHHHEVGAGDDVEEPAQPGEGEGQGELLVQVDGGVDEGDAEQERDADREVGVGPVVAPERPHRPRHRDQRHGQRDHAHAARGERQHEVVGHAAGAAAVEEVVAHLQVHGEGGEHHQRRRDGAERGADEQDPRPARAAGGGAVASGLTVRGGHQAVASSISGRRAS